MFGTNQDRAFFSDMLANGIPVKDNISMQELYEQFEDIANKLEIFDVDIYKEAILFSENSEPVIAIRKEEAGSTEKLFFFTADPEASMEHAALIGKILFLAVTFCQHMNVLNFTVDALAPQASKNEEFDFESDFI